MDILAAVLVYATVATLFYFLVPPPHPVCYKAGQYYAHYSSHVSLFHCFISLILSNRDIERSSIVFTKFYLYGYDFCGENKTLYELTTIVKFNKAKA